jgi:general secretion pathway protein I
MRSWGDRPGARAGWTSWAARWVPAFAGTAVEEFRVVKPARPRAQAGFTLLEAIVAIVVLFAALVPLYVLVSGVSRSALQVDAANREAEYETDALNIMSQVNPSLNPTGAVDLGPYAVQWNAQPVLKPIDGSAYPAGISAFRIGLYDAKVDVVRHDGRVVVSFPLRMIGYEHVRDSLFH